MKHILLLGLWVMGLLGVGLPAYGQADDSRRSRLDIQPRQQAAPPGEGIGRLPYAPSSKPAEVKVNRSATVNRYYRTLARGKAAVPAAPAPVVAAETNRAADEVPAADLLFSGEKIRVSNLYPNPATDYVYVDYQLEAGAGPARLAFYSPLGTRLSDHVLGTAGSRLRISTLELPNGIYFYQLSVDGRTVATKKLLVRH